MILSQRGSCLPRSLGRRPGEVRVRVIIIIFGIVLVLVLLILLLRVLLLGALRRTIIRHPVVRGDVLLGGVVGRQFVLAGRRAAWKLDGSVRHCLVD